MMSNNLRWFKRIATLGTACAGLAFAAPAYAWPCQVTNFTDRTLSSLSEVQRLSFVTEMTRTEYDRLKAEKPGSANHYALLVQSATISDARKAARDKLYSIGIKNVDGYRLGWSTEFLSDESLMKFADCVTARQPGLVAIGRRIDANSYNLVISHLTPIGIEKITTELVASYNVANVSELDQFMNAIGAQDNYAAKSFTVRIAEPGKRTVLVLRGGWETPLFVYIPSYPAADYFKQP
jgi:hypothetical protein